MKIICLLLAPLSCVFLDSCSRNAALESNKQLEAKEELVAAKQLAVDEDSTQESSESDLHPELADIEEDCVGFVRSTGTLPTASGNIGCPDCPATARVPALHFDDMTVERISPAAARCEVAVTIRATFNQSTRQEITGGLVGWIPAEQRTQYLNGQTPAGQQTYHVIITYTREGNAWRVVEFDRAGTPSISDSNEQKFTSNQQQHPEVSQ